VLTNQQRVPDLLIRSASIEAYREGWRMMKGAPKQVLVKNDNESVPQFRRGEVARGEKTDVAGERSKDEGDRTGEGRGEGPG